MADGAQQLLELYPQAGCTLPAGELYLREPIGHAHSRRPFVYANFASSLDGCIAVADGRGGYRVPSALASPLDWDLFRQLQAHADCLVTHGGYLRALAEGRLGDILHVGRRADDARFERWRHARGRDEQPALVVLSASLDFPLPPALREPGRRAIVLTGRNPDGNRAAALRAAGVRVVETGADGQVDGPALVDALTEFGVRRAYLQAGPDIVHSLLGHGLLDRLYLTLSQCLLGAVDTLPLMPGGAPLAPGRLRLRHAYLARGDDAAPDTPPDEAPGRDACEQLFLSYDVRRPRQDSQAGSRPP